MRILLADDHTLFRQMLREVLLSRDKNCVIVGEAADGDEALSLVARYLPDLLLLDYKMPGIGRLSAFCQEVTRQSLATRILVASGYEEEEIAREAAVGGAYGYILKGAPITALLSAITTVQAGGIWVDPHLPRGVFHAFLSYKQGKTEKLRQLSRQELQILSLVAKGMANKEIGAHLYISPKTVKNHLTHIFAKLGMAGRQQATLYFHESGEPLSLADGGKKSSGDVEE